MQSRTSPTKVRLALGLIIGPATFLLWAISTMGSVQHARAQANSFVVLTLPPPTQTLPCGFPGGTTCTPVAATATWTPTATRTPRPGLETPLASPSNTAGPDLTSTPSNTPTKSPIPGATFTPSITPTSSPSPSPTPQLAIIPRFAAAVEQLIPSEYVWLYLLVALTAMAVLGAGIWYIATRRK